jgi:flagellar hook assembly protein FlgD
VAVYLPVTADNYRDGLPEKTSLNSNYPNPFNTYTEINFALAETGPVALEIFNINGRVVKTLMDDIIEAGYHTISWSGFNNSGDPIASGTYFYRLKTSTESIVRKMVLLK